MAHCLMQLIMSSYSNRADVHYLSLAIFTPRASIAIAPVAHNAIASQEKKTADERGAHTWFFVALAFLGVSSRTWT